MQDNRIKVLLVDNFGLTREGIRLILGNNSLITVSNCISMKELESCLFKNEYEVIIFNVATFSDPSQINQIGNFTKSGIPVLVIISKNAEIEILECLNAGIKGIICEDSDTKQFFEAINALSQGLTFTGKAVKKIVLNRKNKDIGSNGSKHFINELSLRETEVLQLFALGYTYKEIGDHLHISPRTVESHKINILAKLGLTKVAQLVKFAVKHGLTGN